MLEATDVRGLWSKLYRFSIGHDAVHRFGHLAESLVFLLLLILQADGFRSVRTLAEREGLVFVEGVKPR